MTAGTLPARQASATGLLIVDDHPIVLQGFRHLVAEGGRLSVYEAPDIVAGYRAFHRHRPGLVVTDLRFQDDGLSGLSLIRRIRALAPKTRILVFSMHADPVVVSRALECGALGFVRKDAGVAAFLEAFDAVGAGRFYLDHGTATAVAMLRLESQDAPFARLSARELQVLSLLGKGKSYHEIADVLSLSYRTVVNASAEMRRKLGAGSQAELIQIAITHPESLLLA
ncbi:response regulator transcription factor [Methylobacterium sp. A54F]